MGIRLYAIVEANGEVYTSLLPLCLVLGLNSAHSAGLAIEKEDLTMKCRRARTNQSPGRCTATCICLSRPPSSVMWMTCRKKRVCFATHTGHPRLGKAKGGNAVGAIGAVFPDTTHKMSQQISDSLSSYYSA